MSLLFNSNPFFFPNDVVDDKSSSKEPMSKDDIVKFLGDDDDDSETIDLEEKKDDKEDKEDKTDDKEDKKDKKDKDDEDTDDKEVDKEDKEDEEELDPLDEIEEELEEPDDEKLELTTPVPRREILKKYPKVFEDFPYLEKAMYREQQFTKMFPNPKDAEEVVGKADVLDKFEADLAKGDSTKFFQAVSATPKSFNKLVDNLLPTLAKVNKEAYNHLFGNIIKHTIISMVKEGRSAKDDELTTAAEILNKFMFRSDEFEPPKNLASDKDDVEEDKVSQKEREFKESRLKSSVNDISEKVRGSFKKTIAANIDKKLSMTEFTRKAASNQALETLENLINKDSRFRSLADRLWEKAIEEDFSKESMDRIKRAFFSKAQILLPSVLKKVRSDAMKGTGKRAKDTDVDTTKNDKNDDKEDNSSRRSRTPDKSAKNAIPKGMTSLEYLMQD